MKVKDMAAKTDKELQALIAEQQGKLAKLRLEARTQKVTNVKEIKAVKKDIARAKTLSRERQIASQEASNA